MQFCSKCDNMYYKKLDSSNPNLLVNYCRNCGHVDEMTEKGVCVLNTQLKQNEQKFNHIVNEYTKLDPSLPRIHTMRCPNQECKSNTGSEKGYPEIIYMRYDDNNLKYIYICTECDTVWKTDDAK